MKILMLSLYYPYPLNQGSNIRVFNVLKRLARRHEVDLITFASPGADAAPGLETLRQYCGDVRVAPAAPPVDGRLVRAMALLSPAPRSIVLNHSTAMASAIAAQVKRVSYDVVLVEWLWLASYVMHMRSLPRVLDDHNAEAAMFKRQIAFQSGTTWSRARRLLTLAKIERYERRVVQAFDEVIATTELDRDRLAVLSNARDKVTAAPNGVDVESMPFDGFDRLPHRLVYNGSMTYAPNLDACTYFVEQIFPLIRQRRPDATFAITGKAPATIPASFTATRGVELLGYQDDVMPVVGGSAVCVVPLRLGGGVRLKIPEAMALGTPVVSTSVGAEGLHVTDGRNILIADNPVDFASHVVRLLDDAALRQRLAHAARGFVEGYSWEATTVAIETVLARAASRQNLLRTR